MSFTTEVIHVIAKIHCYV